MNSKQVLTAPVDGIVQEPAIHTVGGVVTPAQELMKIVPESRQLVVEGLVGKQGYRLRPQWSGCRDQDSHLPLHQNGVIDAIVDNVSSDATADEQRGLIYKARMLMTKNTLLVDGHEVIWYRE